MSNETTEYESATFSTEVSYIREFIDALAAYRDEGKIIIREDAIFSKVTDPADAAMCISKIQGTALNSIKMNTNESDEIVIGANFERMLDMLKGVSGTNEVEITYPVKKKGKNVLFLRLDVIEDDLTFDIPGINVNEVPDIPQNEPISYKTRIVVDGSELKKAIGHCDKIYTSSGGAIIFKTSGNEFIVKASDKVDGDVEKKFRQSGPASESSLGEATVFLGRGYLKDIAPTLGKSEEVEIHIKHEHPVRLDVSLDQESDAKIIYMIAPRIDEMQHE